MSMQTAALVQVVLEGVALPATKTRLVDYARREDPDVARLLEALPDREYRSVRPHPNPERCGTTRRPTTAAMGAVRAAAGEARLARAWPRAARAAG
jgi:Protein of unknown function (DUF2795)